MENDIPVQSWNGRAGTGGIQFVFQLHSVQKFGITPKKIYTYLFVHISGTTRLIGTFYGSFSKNYTEKHVLFS